MSYRVVGKPLQTARQHGRLTEQVTIGRYSSRMSEENVALAQRVYDAFNQRDVPSLLALLAPEIEIHTPEGVQRGLEAVGRSAEQQTSQEEHSVPHARVDQVFDAGERVVVFTTLQVRWKETGEVGFEQPGAAVLTMQAGKVLRWQMLSAWIHRSANGVAGFLTRRTARRVGARAE